MSKKPVPVQKIPSDLVTVENFLHPFDADLAAGRLEAEGIRVWRQFENHVYANFLHSVAIGGIRLQVEPKDRHRARLILRRLREGRYALREEDIPKEMEFSKEESEADANPVFHRPAWVRWLWGIVVFLLLILNSVLF